MPDDDPLRTSVTLLGRLRRDPKDQAAWNDFVARYGPRILQWCRGWNLQESDSQDVAQEVLLKLNGLMARFVYDPSGSFRGWLKTLDASRLARPPGRSPAIGTRGKRRACGGASGEPSGQQ
jgi:hypothetical protein